jgi:hypothetical protein
MDRQSRTRTQRAPSAALQTQWAAPEPARLDPETAEGQLVNRAIAAVFDRPGDQADTRSAIREALEWALAQRGATDQDLRPAPPPVFSLGLDAMRLCILRKELIFLLAASLDKRVAHRVLPAHIEVLRQLSLDEFTLLANFPASARGTPIGNASVAQPNTPGLTVYRHILSDNLASLLEYKDNVPQYIDNLLRLGLVSIRPGSAAPEVVYRSFARHRFLIRLLDRAPPRSQIQISPHALTLTDFGSALRGLCVGQEGR